ncbi:hypothetical protein DY000_02039915 [Brassica cretica]|uniref:Uncharacterized protein n=1 Tax=Brassica cretica TaxID=69181 RepID=A0ABQ7BIF3_BRACR|nr:hypothetical protein DY000_02039915 [Brassica cretica]
MKIWRSFMDVGVAPDVKITQGLEGSLGTRRSRKDPKVTWEPVGFPLDLGIMIGARRLYEDPKILRTLMPDRNLEVLPQILRSLLGPRRLSGNPEKLATSSSYDVFYFCRKSLTGLEGAGVGVMTQVPGFAAFHVWISRDYEVLPDFCTFALWTPMRLRLHRGFRNGGIWRPDPARMPL